MTEPAPAEVIAYTAGKPASDPWWRGAVIYENHLPSFRDGNGDGIGDLQGLIEGLDYLSETVGVDAVWVGPFFRSPLLDHGFDISDYTAVEPVFGDLETFDRLVAEAHRRGIKIIVDYVPNHTSDQHPWFLESRSSRDNPKRDWYTWRDPTPDGDPPNNWVAESGGSVWEYDERTAQYYLHSHLREQPDLNWRNADVRAALFDVLRFWMDRGADGVRIDVAHMLMKDPELRDNPPNPDGTANPYDIQHPDFHSQLHVNDRRHPDVHQALGEVRAVLEEYEGRVAIGEIEAMEWPAWAEYYGQAQRLDGLHLPFPFQLIETAWDAEAVAETISALEAALPDRAWPILALGNHDRSRLATRLGREQARVAAMLLMTLRGTVSILYGDELGLVDQDVPPDRQRDYFGLGDEGVSRDPTRTPMPWDEGPNAGFSSADAAELWLPVSFEQATINVASQLQNPASMLNLYRRLIAARHESRALRLGDYAEIIVSDGCLAFSRKAEGDRKGVVLNLTAEPVSVDLPFAGPVLIATSPEGAAQSVDSAIQLRGNEGLVIELGSESRS